MLNLVLEIGEATRQALPHLSVKDSERVLADIRSIYSVISTELLRTLPLKNDLLRHLKCLHPSMRQHEDSHLSIMNIVRTFPQMLVPDDIDRVSAEWYVYQNESIPKEWFEKSNEYYSIDHYWRKVLALKSHIGGEKYVGLAKLIKCTLALSHGNADAERGFSENAFLVSDERSLLNDASINGLRATRDGIKFFGDGKVHQVSITKDLLESVRRAHARYSHDVKKQQQDSPEQTNDDGTQVKKDLFAEEENELHREQGLLQKSLSNVQKMIDEGTERLAKAITMKNFEDIETAQLLIEGGNKKLAVTNAQLLQNNDQLSQLRKKQKR